MLLYLLRGALALALLLTVACGDASPEQTPAPPQTTLASVPNTSTAPAPTSTVAAPTTTQPRATSTVPPTTEAPPTTTTTTQPDGVVDIVVDVYEGQVDAEDRIAVRVGDEVTLTVTSDVSDHVHVHGYDIFGDVAPGAPAVLEFVADIPGIFEVELEDARLELFELVVEP